MNALPVTDAELASLAASHDIITLGMLADEARRQRHGARTTFVRVADVAAEPGAPLAWPQSAGEIRIVGAPSSRAAAVERVGAVAARANGVPVSAFSLAELEQLAAREGVTLRSILEELRAAGLELVAEAPFDKLLDPRRSIEEVNIAGLSLARLTIQQLPSADVPSLLKRVAGCSRPWRSIRAFAPLPRKLNPAVPTTGYDDVKRVALARLVVDNVPSIQVDWALYGPKLAQVALTVGADDVDAVSADDQTTAGAAARAARGDPPQYPRGQPGAGGAQRAVRVARPMTPVRLGAVGYLNARPLVYGLERVVAFRSFDSTCRRVCADLLHEGEIDVGLIPSIEYLRGPADAGHYRIVPDVAIASRGAGRIGRALHEEADVGRAFDRDGYELADVGRACRRAVRPRCSRFNPRSNRERRI